MDISGFFHVILYTLADKPSEFLRKLLFPFSWQKRLYLEDGSSSFQRNVSTDLPSLLWILSHKITKSSLGIEHWCFNTSSVSSSVLSFTIVKRNSTAWVSERSIPTERTPPFGEVSASFCGQRVPCHRDGSTRPESLLFLSSSSSIVFTRLSEPRSRPTTSQKIW
jgi:hypothetical protein